MIEILASIETPRTDKRRFTAGIVLWDDRVVEAAPIIRFMKGWSREQVRKHCLQRGWTVTVVHQLQRSRP